jgi:protein involved in polysaccharide export with SLBB domain
MIREKHLLSSIFILSFIVNSAGLAQIEDEGKNPDKQSTAPRALNFSDIFKTDQTTREEFESLKRQNEIKIREQMNQSPAIETAVDPAVYLVGPGDIFSLNVWGAIEQHYPIMVNPEGKLQIPSVGEVAVAGRRLADVQKDVLEKSQAYYQSIKLTLSLEAVRFFRVHVVGEVRFPGTYIVQAMTRVSEAIIKAGGTTEWARKNAIQLRREDHSILTIDLDAFEHGGDLEQVPYLNGGDVIRVPPMLPSEELVTVEGDFRVSGMYQLKPNENLLDFLTRINAFKRNTDLEKVMVLRTGANSIPQPVYRIGTVARDSLAAIKLQSFDRIIMPSNYVYVKGAVLSPGAYPFLQNMKAGDYAGMSGCDYRSGSIKGIKVYHIATRIIEKGEKTVVEPGDIIEVAQSRELKIREILSVIATLASVIISAKAVGIWN